MGKLARLRTVAVASLIAILASSCYLQLAWEAEQNGDPVPWFCDPVAVNSVTGPGMGFTNWYAGVPRGPLSHSDCKVLAAQLDLAQKYAMQYPTRGDAEAAGYFQSFERITGMGTHHGLGVLSPADLQNPAFDPTSPEDFLNSGLPGHVDAVFEPGRPEFLQYDGNSPDSPLVGMSYFVYTDTGLPPEGFVGDNDRWHHHPTICHDPNTAVGIEVNISDSACQNLGKINVHLDNFYMLHAWVVPDIELHDDVFAPIHPCIKPLSQGGAVFDMDDPCHDVLPAAGAPVPVGASSGASPISMLSCPLALGPDADHLFS
ncbi:MAG: hypothetical protein AAF548_13860 [Actinomycetota bacterium]